MNWRRSCNLFGSLRGTDGNRRARQVTLQSMVWAALRCLTQTEQATAACISVWGPGIRASYRDKPGHIWGTPKVWSKEKGAVTCLPLLQETMGLVRTNGLVFPKFVLHVLVAKSFEVWGQDPVQQQDAPIQGADTRDVLSQHTATGTSGCACAKGPSVPAPLRSRLLLTASPGGRARAIFIRFGPTLKSGPSGNPGCGGGREMGGAGSSPGGAWLSWSRACAGPARGCSERRPPEVCRRPVVSPHLHPSSFSIPPTPFPPGKGLKKPSSKSVSSRKASIISWTYFRHLKVSLRSATAIRVRLISPSASPPNHMLGTVLCSSSVPWRRGLFHVTRALSQ